MGIKNMSPQSGRVLKEDDTVVNKADMLEAIYKALIVDKNAGVAINGSLANLPTVTILAGQSLSGAVDLSTQCLIGLSMPSTWSTAAVITFAGSVDGVTFNPIYYQGGEFIISEAAASRQITIDPTALLPWRYVKIRSGTASAPVNRSQDNVITLLTKPLA